MRPQSDIRVSLGAALVDGHGTTRQLAVRTGWSISAVRTALDNMARAGDVVVLPVMVRQQGVKRPVPVYARAVRPCDATAHDALPHISLVMAWATASGSACAALGGREAAM